MPAMHFSVKLFLLLSLLQACKEPLKAKDGTVFKSPGDYNEYIISRQTRVIRNFIELSEQIEHHPDTAGVYLAKCARQADSVISDIQGMPPFKTDSAFRDAAIRSFTFYRSLFNEHYPRLLKIRLQGGAETEEGINEIMEVMDKVKREEEQLDKKLHRAQRDFAERFDMKMRPNAIQKEMEKKN